MKVLGRTNEYPRNKNKGLRNFRRRELVHKIPWPIDLSRRNFQLTNYFGERNYSNHSYGSHPGIDIQVRPGTPVVAPETSRLVSVDQDKLRDSSNLSFGREFNLGDIKIYGIGTGLLYTLSHLSWDSIREHMRSARPSDLDFTLEIKKGELIGKVGLWPYSLGPKVLVPSDVYRSFKRGYSHLHFETASYDYDDSPTFIFPEQFTHLNPLLVLQELNVPKPIWRDYR